MANADAETLPAPNGKARSTLLKSMWLSPTMIHDANRVRPPTTASSKQAAPEGVHHHEPDASQ
jgi:hypothetical protein